MTGVQTCALPIYENAIREAAYYIWQNAGCPQGQDEKFWSMAIEQLNAAAPCCSKSSAGKSASCKSASAKKAAPKKTVKK